MGNKQPRWILDEVEASDEDKKKIEEDLQKTMIDGSVEKVRDYIRNRKYGEIIYDFYCTRKDPTSLNMLGLMYYYGCGIEKDIDEAVRYFEKSADLGGEKAIDNLVKIHAKNIRQIKQKYIDMGVFEKIPENP